MKTIRAIIAGMILMGGLAACENHMDINDIEAGTPSNADTVLAPSKTEPLSPEALEEYNKNLPSVYQR